MSAIDDFLNKKNDVAQKYLKIIGHMIADTYHYGYAEDTLMGIYDDVEAMGRITDAEIQAVENIQAKPTSHYGRRRY